MDFNNLHIVESVCQVVCLCHGQIYLSHISHNWAHPELLICLLVLTVKLSSSRVQATHYGVISFLYKPFSSSANVNKGFIKTSKLYTPRARIIEKGRSNEERFIFQNQTNRRKKKIIHEIESIMAGMTQFVTLYTPMSSGCLSGQL